MIINSDGLFTFHVGRRISHKVCDYLKYYALRMLIEINLLYLLSISNKLIIESGCRIGYKACFNRQSYIHYRKSDSDKANITLDF